MSGPLSVEIRNLAELSAEEGVQWNRWARADPDLSSPYFRWEFARTAGPICPGSAVAVFKRDGHVVGYYPHQRRGGTVQPLAAPMNDYHGVIGPRDDKPSMQEAAAIIEKSEQYRRTGHHDIFACGWTEQVLHALMDCQGEDGFGASMAVLRVDGRVVAMEYSMHAGRHFHLWFPVYEQEVARWSPGIVLTQETIRLGSERGYRIFDYGVGVGGNYKKYYDDGGLVTAEGVVARPGVGNAMCATASAALGVLGHARAGRLRLSTRRRWSVIEACETSLAGQAAGALRAAADMVRKQKAAGSAD